jgi:hypothetical protein
MGDLIDPGPSMTALFWDEREDTIDMGNSYIDMTGWPNTPQLTQWDYDRPASYHGRAGGCHLRMVTRKSIAGRMHERRRRSKRMCRSSAAQ